MHTDDKTGAEEAAAEEAEVHTRFFSSGEWCGHLGRLLQYRPQAVSSTTIGSDADRARPNVATDLATNSGASTAEAGEQQLGLHASRVVRDGLSAVIRSACDTLNTLIASWPTVRNRLISGNFQVPRTLFQQASPFVNSHSVSTHNHNNVLALIALHLDRAASLPDQCVFSLCRLLTSMLDTDGVEHLNNELAQLFAREHREGDGEFTTQFFSLRNHKLIFLFLFGRCDECGHGFMSTPPPLVPPFRYLQPKKLCGWGSVQCRRLTPCP